jgi:type II secretory pathway component PulM
MIEKIRQLVADAAQYLAAASPRERRLLLLASGGVVVFLLLVIWVGFGASIRRHQDSLDEKRNAFEKVQRLAAGYNREEQERQLLEARLRQSPPALMGFVDEIAHKEGVDISSMSDLGVRSGGQNGRPRENAVELSLARIPLDKLMRMLQDIEHSPGVVRVRRLQLRKSSENKETLDVRMTVSAWQGA